MLLVYKTSARFAICFNGSELLSAVVCAANCCRVVCAAIRRSSHGACGSFDDRRRRLHRRRSLCQQKSHGVCLALWIMISA